VIDNQDQVIISRLVRGLIQFGIDSNDGDRRRIHALDPKIAPEFDVPEDGKRSEVASPASL
jgi:hypothetical protein